MANLNEQVRACQNALSALNLQNRGIPGATAYLEEVLDNLERQGPLGEHVAVAIRTFLDDRSLPTAIPPSAMIEQSAFV